jgi:hypothetical protein
MSETKPPKRLWRSIVAALAGFFAVVILSLGTDVVLHAAGIYPPWAQRMSDGLFVLATAYRVVYTIGGSYITARLAPDRPMLHAMVLGVIGLVMCLVGAVATWNADLGPMWYSVALVVTALSCVWIGGKLRVWQLAHRADGVAQA